MSLNISQFKVNDTSAYLTGVDMNLDEIKNTQQPASCQSVNKHIMNELKNSFTNKLYYHKELSLIKEINGAIIGIKGDLIIKSNYFNLFSVRIYDISNVSKIIYDGCIHGNMMNYVISSTLDIITPLVTGQTSLSTNDYDTYDLTEIENVENGLYLFVTFHYDRYVNVYDANNINENLFLYRKSIESFAIKPHNILADSYIYAYNNLSESQYKIQTSEYHYIKYYDISGLKQIIINGISGNNILSYAISTSNSISSYSVADIILKKEIKNGCRYISEIIDLPDNAKSLYITIDKSSNVNNILNKYPLNVYSSDYKTNISIKPLPKFAIFNDYIIQYKDEIYSLYENKGNYKVVVYDVSQYTSIRLCGYNQGTVVGYAFTSIAYLNETISAGYNTTSQQGLMYIDEIIDVPTGAKYIYVTQNHNLNFPLCVCNSYDLNTSEHINNIQNRENDYLGTDYILCPIYGQSLAIGGDANPITHYGNLRHREYMHCNEKLTCTFDSLETSKYGLMESFFDSYFNNTGKSMNQLYTDIISFVQGQGSLSIQDFVKGSSNYNSLINKVKTAYDWVHDTLGKTLVVPAFCWIQGETDRNDNSFDYKAMLEQLRIDINNDIKEITSQIEEVHCIVYQTNQLSLAMDDFEYRPNDYEILNTRLLPAQAQYELIRDNEYFHAASPIYNMNFVVSSNGQMIHIDSKSQKLLGYYEGISLYKIMCDPYGNKNTGLIISSVEYIDETHLKVILNVSCPPIVIDTDLVKEIENYGFSVINENNQNIIKSVKINNNSIWATDIIIETTSECHNSKLRYAVNGEFGYSGWERGPRGNIRDSQGLYKKAIIQEIEIPLHNWLYACELSIQ